MLNIGCNHLLVFNSHLFMLMPPYIYIPTNVFTIKSEQKNKNQRKCSFCLCFFNKYYVFCGIKYSIGKYQYVFFLWLLIVKKKNFSTCTGQRTHFWCFWWKIYTRMVTGMQTKWNENYVQRVIWKWSTRFHMTKYIISTIIFPLFKVVWDICPY